MLWASRYYQVLFRRRVHGLSTFVRRAWGRRSIHVVARRLQPGCGVEGSKLVNLELRSLSYRYRFLPTSQVLSVLCTHPSSARCPLGRKLVSFLKETHKCTAPRSVDKSSKQRSFGVVKFLFDRGEYQATALNDAFTCAAGEGHLEVMKLLHSSGCRPLPDDAFKQAAAGGHLEVVEFLFNNRANKIPLLDAAFVQAATCGHLEVLEFLFNNGANRVSLLDDAFKKAAAGYRLEVMKFPFENGEIAVDEGPLRTKFKNRVDLVMLVCTDTEDMTALLNGKLIQAAGDGDWNVMGLLLANGVNQGPVIEEAFIKAVQHGHTSTAKLLYAQGVSRSLLDDAFATAAEYGNLRIVKFLRSKVTQSSFDGAFVKAATSGYSSVLQFLFKYKNIQTSVLDDMLIAAAARGHFDVIEFLLIHGGGSRTSLIDDAFITAASTGHCGIAKILYNHGGGCKKSVLEEAFTRAAVRDRSKVIEFLFDKGVSKSSSNDAFKKAVAHGNLQLTRFLFHKGVCKSLIKSMFTTACGKGCYAIAKFLFDNTDVQASLVDDAFIKATSGGRSRIVELLNDWRGRANALTEAAAEGNSTGVRDFLSKGVSKSVIDDAFTTAAANGHVRIVKSILGKGVSGSALDDALTKATCNGHSKVVQLLSEHKTQ